jgi:hypothetical protein
MPEPFITTINERFMKNVTTSVKGGFVLACLLFFSQFLSAQTIFGLSSDRLIAFQANNPAMITQSPIITGVAMGQTLVGLDFRPATGQLYAMGYNAATGAANLYTLDRATGAATTIGSNPLTLNVNITDFGFDFNPTVDRIRVTGSDNSNYRLHPVTGVLVATDGNLAYAAADANAAADPNVVASAYTNSYIGATSTTLYNFDATLNVLVTQIPPNNGTLNTIGGSGLALNAMDASVDVDITFDANMSANMAFLAANTGVSNNDDLYSLNLTTGAATLLGSIGNGLPVRDIAVVIDRMVPANVTGNLLYALNAGNNLISFDSNLPGVVRTLVAVTGVAAGQTLSGLDFRPATGELYGIGYNAMNGETRLYTIQTATGVATPVGAAPITLAANLGKVGMDFNPTVDRIRVTSSSNANYRLHPVTGALAATDMNLAFAGANAGVNPSIGAVAYTNSFNGSGTTTLYNYDDSLNVITTQIPPNNGTLNTVGNSGIVLNLADPTADMDIFYNLSTGQNTAYLVANPGTQASDNLYTLNLATGAAMLVGKIGMGIAITDVTAFLTVPPVETACDDKATGCARFEMISVRRDAVGDEIYRLRITNTCASPLNYVAFSLPNGVEAISPAATAVYTAPSTRAYQVRNPNYSPFYSIRFKANGTGIANGQSDIFEYKLPKQADVSYINAYVKLMDGSVVEAYLNTFNCPTQASSGNKPETDDRDNTPALQTSAVRVFPNPTAGQLFVDLSSWTEQEVRLTVFNTVGQQVLQQVSVAASTVVSMELPANTAPGLYYLEVVAADGTREVKRIVVQ